MTCTRSIARWALAAVCGSACLSVHAEGPAWVLAYHRVVLPPDAPTSTVSVRSAETVRQPRGAIDDTNAVSDPLALERFHTRLDRLAPAYAPALRLNTAGTTPVATEVPPGRRLRHGLRELDEALHDDPYRYSRTPHVEHRPGAWLYEEEILGAAWSALRSESPLLQRADEAVREVREATTVTYTGARGRTYRARLSGSMQEARLRLRTDSASRRTHAEACVGTDAVRVALARHHVAADAVTVLEYEVDESHNNHKIQVRFEKAWW